MTTACIIAAVLIIIAGLFAVIVERTTERDDARAERDRLERELEARPRLRLVTDDLTALEATSYTWPAIARDAFPVREWGEEAES